METLTLRPTEANALAGIAAVKSRESYRKQQALHVVPLRNIRASEEQILY